MAGTIASLNVKIGADIRNLQRGLAKSKRLIKKQGKEMQALGNNLSMAVTLPVIAFLGRSAQLWDKQANAMAQVEAGIKSTGSAAGFTAEQFQDMARGLQRVTIFGDEDILQNVTAQLQTFTNVVGPQFERAQKAILDVSTRMKVDLKSAAIQVGKALNDPAVGLSMLTRVGITFTEEQKNLIKSLVETGKQAQAQEIILKELERQFGGSAEAAAKAGAGPIKQFQNAMGDAMELVGKSVLPTLIELAKKLTGAVRWFAELSEGTRKSAIKIALFAAAVGPSIKVLGFLITSASKLNLIFITLGRGITIASAVMKKQALEVAAGTSNITRMGMAVTGLKTAWKSFDVATKATAIGLVAAAIGLAIIAFQKLNHQLSAAEKVQMAVNDVHLSAQKNIVAERLEAERLTGILKDNNAAYVDKKAALDKLAEISPDYFGGLDVEKSSLKDINTAYESYIKNILKAAEAQAVQQKIIELDKKRLDLLTKEHEIRKAGAFFGAEALNFDNLKKQIDELEARKKKLAKAFADVAPIKKKKKEKEGGDGGGAIRPLIAVSDLLPPPQDLETSAKELAAVIGTHLETQLPQVQAMTAGYKNALTELGETYDIIDNKAAVFGTGFNSVREKIAATQSAITSMLESGMSPFSNTITTLQEKLTGLNAKLDENKEKWVEFGAAVNEIVNTAIAESITNLAIGIGEAIAGIGGATNIAGLAIAGIADMMIQLGKLAIKTGVATAGIKAALESLNPALAIAGGIALIGLASLIKAKVSSLKPPALAEGGIAMAPTLAMVGDNPGRGEAIIPLEKFDSIFGQGRGGPQEVKIVGHRISGKDLLLLVQSAQSDMKRLKGK